jgi:hypothetical protein
MTKYVSVPDVGVVGFPDDATTEQITEAVNKQFNPKYQTGKQFGRGRS